MLVGLPGAGKTTVGRRVAAALGRPFLDFDEEIERREGRPVGEIFAERGEGYSRALERRLTEEICAAGDRMVLAPGGGWITIPGVVELIRPRGALIYLTARPETALRRMGTLRARRPLLSTPHPLDTLTRLLGERGSLYESAADHVIDTEGIDVQGVTRLAIEWISFFRRNQIMPDG